MGEENQSERQHEEKQRGRGPEGQHPLIPNKVLHVQHVNKAKQKDNAFCWTSHSAESEITQPNAVLLPQPSLDLSRDKTSPEKAMTSPKTSPHSPGELPTNEQRNLPSAQPIIEEEEATERESLPASAKPGEEAADPASQGTRTINLF